MKTLAYIIFGKSEEVFFAVFHVLLQTGDGDLVTGLVTRKPYVHLVLLHHLSNGLTTSTDEATVNTVVYGDLFTDLLLLNGWGKEEGEEGGKGERYREGGERGEGGMRGEGEREGRERELEGEGRGRGRGRGEREREREREREVGMERERRKGRDK